MSDGGRLTGELVTGADEDAVEVVAADAAERLACVCVGWPAERFRSLVLDVALVRLHHGVPRAELESIRHRLELRQRTVHRDAVRPPPLPLPPPSRGYPAAPDPSASAPP